MTRQRRQWQWQLWQRSAHIILIRQCPSHAPILIHPIHPAGAAAGAVVAACHLMEFAAYALRMPGIILSTAAFRFL